MRKYRIRELYNNDYRECIFGSAETGRHGIYLVYGEANAGEEREMGSGGHEEIFLLLEGEGHLKDGETELAIAAEEAAYLAADRAFNFVACKRCRYVVAGGHPSPHGH